MANLLEQCNFTGGSLSSLAMASFLTEAASSNWQYEKKQVMLHIMSIYYNHSNKSCIQYARMEGASLDNVYMSPSFPPKKTGQDRQGKVKVFI